MSRTLRIGVPRIPRWLRPDQWGHGTGATTATAGQKARTKP